MRPVAWAAVRVMPGLVDVGFLGWMAFPLPVRLAFHLPLVVTLLAAVLAALLVAGAVGRWGRGGPYRDAPMTGSVIVVRRQLLGRSAAMKVLVGSAGRSPTAPAQRTPTTLGTPRRKAA
jgi:hypothetical protein